MGKSHTARLILGDNVIFPDEIAKACGLQYTKDQLRHFAETLPSKEVLRILKANNFALVAGPPSPMSLLDILEIESEDLSFSEMDGWHKRWFEEDQKFAKNDKTPTEWLAIRKEPVPGSMKRNWNEQLDLIKAKERVPNASEMSWFLTIFFKVRVGVRLFKLVRVRTLSVDSDGDQIYIGYGSNGLSVDGDWSGDRDDGVGVASAWKFF